MPLAAVRLFEAATQQGVVLIPYRMDRNPRLRHLRIVIDESNQVVLKTPLRVSDRQAVCFLNENADWVLQRLQQRPATPSLLDYLRDRPRLSMGGKTRPIAFYFRARRPAFDLEDPEEVALFIDAQRDREIQLRWMLLEIAKRCLPQRVDTFSRRHGLKVHGVRIRDQRSRWGSCSETGGLSLNWRLILLPPRLQDHIILHELAHLQHFDHSKDFYKLLHQLDPQSTKHSEELTDWSYRVMGLARNLLQVAS